MTESFTGFPTADSADASAQEQAQLIADTPWFDESVLGLFIHWDHASQQGLELSWPMVDGVNNPTWRRAVSVEQYRSSAATFNPTNWDPVQLAKDAKAAGMTYAVLTTRHHNGYCLFHTDTTDYTIEHSPYGRDIVREFVDAMRAEGLRIGLYYSLSDWHQVDYPAFGDDVKPYSVDTLPQPTPAQWDRYMTYMQTQLRELLTNYGQIDMLWFDGHWERPIESWRPAELKELIRGLQPNILVNDRLPGLGNFRTPEQFVPDLPLEGRWETCMTMNQNWGYVADDHNYKSALEIVQTVVEVASRGGNLLLNVSPTGTGALPTQQSERLAAIAAWMERNRESVQDVRPGLEPWQYGGPSTRRGDRVYLHLMSWPIGTLSVRGLPFKRIEKITLLGTGEELEHTVPFGVAAQKEADPRGEIRISVPGEPTDLVPVIAIDIAPAD